MVAMIKPINRWGTGRASRSSRMLRGPALLLAGFLMLTPIATAQPQAPEQGGKMTPLQLLQVAHTFFGQGDYDSARKYYLRALPAFSKNADVLRDLAFCYYSLGRAGYAQAARYYARAYEIDPANQDVADKLATCYLSLKRPTEAAAILRKTAERPGAPAEIWKKVADAYTDAGDFGQAESAYDVYLQLKPGDLMARTSYALLYGQQKNYAKAQEQLRLVLSSNPNYSPALIAMGRISSWQGQYQDSLDLYERVLRLNPSNGEAQSGKAFVLLWMDHPEEAETLFAQLHRRYPKDDEVLRGMEAAQAAIEQKKLAQARKSGNLPRLEAIYRDRLAKNPKDLEALKALVALTTDPSRCAESIGFARRALELTPDDASLQLTLARSLVRCQQYAEALALYKQYLEAYPKSEEALFNVAQILFREKRVPEATEAFRELLKINPGNRDASLGLAQCLAGSGNYQEALVRFDETLKAEPDNYDALQGKAYILYWTEHFAEARAIFEKLAAQRPSDPQNHQALDDIAKAEEAARWAALRPAPGSPPQDFVVFYQKRLASYPDDMAALKGLAYSQAQANNVPAAIEDYQKVLDQNPDDLDAQKELARLLAQSGQYDKALPLYQSVVKNQPDDTASLEGLGHVYVWSNRPADALPIYQKLLVKDPTNADYRMQLARLELQSKDYGAARDALAAVISADPANREARLALAQLDFSQGRQDESLQNYNEILKQNPKDPDALLGKAQINYYQGKIPVAQAAATEAVEQRPKDFDALFLLANIEHARGRRHQTKEYLNRAAQINPGNPDVEALRLRLRQEAAVTIHTTTGYAREIGPAGTATLGALPVSFLRLTPALDAQNNPIIVPAVVQTEFPQTTVGTLNEDARYQTYGTTIGFHLIPRVDSYFSFTSLPTQSPTPSIRGAVAPWSFVFRNAWHPSRYLTIRGGIGLARFGPADIERSPDTTGTLSDLVDRFGPSVTEGLGITPSAAPQVATKPVGMAGFTVAPSKKFSVDLDWMHGPAVYYPTPRAMRLHLTQTRFDGTLNFFFTPRTELHVNFFYSRLFTDSGVQRSIFLPTDPSLLGSATAQFTGTIVNGQGVVQSQQQVAVPVPAPLFFAQSGTAHYFSPLDLTLDYAPSSGAQTCPVVTIVDQDGNSTTVQPALIATTSWPLCALGQVVTQTSGAADWGKGGSITFTHTFVKRKRFSFDAGYLGTAFSYAGNRRGVFLGYFNPHLYQNHQLNGRIYGKLFGPVGYDIYGGLGVQQTQSYSLASLPFLGSSLSPLAMPATLVEGPFKRSGIVRPSFSLKVSPHLTLGIAYTHYNSAQVLGPLRGNAVSLTTDWTLY
jgi:tetratricopeptide (TPR) repeat protein